MHNQAEMEFSNKLLWIQVIKQFIKNILMIKISTLLTAFRQSFDLKGKATFWFGGIIAAAAKIIDQSQTEIVKDLESFAYVQFLKIINYTLASALNFYPQNPPDDFYRFTSFCNQLLGQSEDKIQNNQFNIFLAKLTLRNSLIIHAFTIKQYGYVFNSCQQVMKEFKNTKIDTFNQIYLTFFSNFISIIKKIQPTKRNQPFFVQLKSELEQNLNLVFSKILDKFARIIQGQGSIDLTEFQLLAGVFLNHRTVFQKKKSYFYDIIEAVIVQTKYKALKGNIYISKIYKQKVERQIFLQFQIPFHEFNHFYQSLRVDFQKNERKNISTREQTQTEEEKKLTKIQKMLQKSLTMLNQNQPDSHLLNNSLPVNAANRFRRLNYVSQTQRRPAFETSKTIDFSTIQPENLREKQENTSILSQKSKRNCSLRHQVTSQMISPSKNSKGAIPRAQTKKVGMNQSLLFTNYQNPNTRNKNSMHQVLHFKMGSIFIEVNDDGILLSDYTKQNKRYVQWNTVSTIVPRFQFKFVYNQYLKYPVFNYYDVIRVLKLYLSKHQNNSIGINEYPNIILELNEFVKFYPQDGKYTKLALMNIYDNTKLQGAIDCYFQQFDHFFKIVSTNGYLNYLSSKIFCDIEPETNKNQIFYLEVLRKQTQSTKQQLQNQLTVDIIEDVTNDKSYSHRAIFILKNNTRIYAKINLSKQTKDNNNQQRMFQITVRRLTQIQSNQCPITTAKNSTRSFELPCYKILQYIPLYDMNLNTYTQRFGRVIFQLFNNFEGLSLDLNMANLNFEVHCHFYLAQMIQIGKYFTVVSAELVGTKTQILGLVIRYNFLPANKEIITFLINPYYGFLANFIGLPKEEKRNSFKKLLVNQSVKQTYLYLQKRKKLNQISSLIEFLSEGIGFF